MLAILLLLTAFVLILRGDNEGVTPALGQGRVLQWQQTSINNNWNTIADLLEIDIPEVMQENAKYKPMGSSYVQKNAGTNDLGDLSFTCLWTATLWASLNGMLRDNTVNFRTTPSTGSNTLTMGTGSGGTRVLFKSCKLVSVYSEDDAIKFVGECVGPLSGG